MVFLTPVLLAISLNPMTVWSSFGFGWHGQLAGACHAKTVFQLSPQNKNSIESVKRHGFHKDTVTINFPAIISHDFSWEKSPFAPDFEALAKLQIRNDHMLISQPRMGNLYIFPIADLPCLEDSAFGEHLAKLLHGKRQVEHLTDISHWTEPLFFPDHRKHDFGYKPDALDVLRRRYPDFDDGKSDHLLEEVDKSRYVFKAHCDFLFLDSSSIKLIHVANGSLYISSEPVDYFTTDKKKKLPPLPDRQLRKAAAPKELHGPFTAYEIGGAYYLFTASQKLFRVKLKGRTDLEISEVLSVQDRLILGVVQFPDDDRVCAFGTDGKPGSIDRVYFEFAEKPVPKKYGLTIKQDKTETDRFREVYDCVKAVLKDNPPKQK